MCDKPEKARHCGLEPQSPAPKHDYYVDAELIIVILLIALTIGINLVAAL